MEENNLKTLKDLKKNFDGEFGKIWYDEEELKAEAIFEEPRPVYKLFEDGNLRMSDSPQEMFLQYDAYKLAHGRVLMGGLGLGMSATLFAEKKEVTEVIVVEISKDVIKLCKPKNNKIKIINKDIWKYLKDTNEIFDFIYIDIHYSTGCMEYIHTVLPMRKIFEEKFKNTLAILTKKRLFEEGKLKTKKGQKSKSETLNKSRESHLNYYKLHPEAIERIKENRAKQIFPIKDTSIEIKIQNFLKQLNIDFLTHQYVKDIKHGYQCDILIPSMNLVIECDGDYWHKYPIGNEIDHIRTSELLEKGFKVLRLWENEIRVMNINKFQGKLNKTGGK